MGRQNLIAVRFVWPLLLLIFVGREVFASSQADKNQCRAAPSADWTTVENWIWNRLCSEQPADLNVLDPRKLSPFRPSGWDDRRLVSPAFLKNILVDAPWSSEIPSQEIELVGVLFRDPINLSGSHIAKTVTFSGARFLNSINLNAVEFEQFLIFDRSRVYGAVQMQLTRINRLLSLQGDSIFTSIDLRGGKMDGAELSGVTVQKQFILNGVTISRGLSLENSKLSEVDLRTGSVGEGVNASGAQVSGLLDMGTMTIGGNLFLRDAQLGTLTLIGTSVSRQLSLKGSNVAGFIEMNSLAVGDSLIFGDPGTYTSASLRGARIGGQLAMAAATFSGPVDMDNITIGGSLIIGQGSHFQSAKLRGAHIQGRVDSSAASFEGPFDLRSSVIEGGVLLGAGSRYRSVSMSGSRMEGGLQVLTSTLADELTLNWARLGDVTLITSTFGAKIEAEYLDVKQNFEVWDAAFSGLDLKGSKIGGEFKLKASKLPLRWSEGATLSLSNVSVDAVEDDPDTWPANLLLDGFEYRRLGGVLGKAGGSPSKQAYVEWLKRDQSKSPQPYIKLAEAYRSMGYIAASHAVEYAGREQLRAKLKAEGDWGNATLQWFLKNVIGYGIGGGYWNSVKIAAVFVLAGWFSLALPSPWSLSHIRTVRRPSSKFATWVDIALFSMSELIPVVNLYGRGDHRILRGLSERGPRHYYFVIHRCVGWVLAGFLVVAITGLADLR